MKKIYSFVLMAAMLLIGTNAWADWAITNTQDFEDAWAASANEDVVMNIQSSNIELSKIMWLGSGHSVVINFLNNNELTVNGPSYGFLLTHGSLTIQGSGRISASCGNELFYVTGSNTQVTDYTTLKIGNGVAINYTTYKAAISIDGIKGTDNGAYKAYGASACVPEKAALTYTTKIEGQDKGEATGVKVEINGAITAKRYAVKTNGDLGYVAANKNYVPFIHIQSNATIQVLDVAPQGQEKKQPLALYASGYANWLIEGTVMGNVGVMVKSGDVDINGATITSTGTEYHATNNSNSGSEARGSAVVISSENAYTGDMDVKISGNAQITAGPGFALEESVPGTAGTKVDVVTVEGATFTAGNGSTGAVIISSETASAATGEGKTIEVAIISAVVDGSLTIQGDDQQGTKLQEITSSSAVIPATDTKPTIIVPLDVQLTSDGYASFSSPIDLFKADDITKQPLYKEFGIYTGVYDGDHHQLELREVGYVKANQGVILYCAGETKNIKCYFTTSGTPDNFNSQYSNNSAYVNDLNCSDDWASQTNKDRIYCLRNVGIGTMLYQYLGAEMPANKAYLDMSKFGSSAPQRIRMVIAQEEQTEAIESVEAASVKAVKFVENGEILIRRGENVYNLQGQIVK